MTLQGWRSRRRHTIRLISSWIEHVEIVQIIQRGKAFATLSAVSAAASKRTVPKPNIMAQLHEVWGDRMFSIDEVAAMRAAELQGEDG